MSAVNLNQSPENELDEDDEAPHSESKLLLLPRACEAGASWRWWVEAFALFRRSPVMWVGMMLIYFIIIGVLSDIPLFYLVLYVIGPVFVGGVMLGCAALDRDEDLEFFHLFMGFHQNATGLLLVGVTFILLLLAFCIVLVVPAYLLGVRDGPVLSVLALTALLCSAVPVWFAPALIVLHGLNPLEAMRLSVIACARNIGPAIGFGLIAFLMLLPVMFAVALLAIVAFTPHMFADYWGYVMLVGLVLALPMCLWLALLLISQYTSYKDIFVEAAAISPAPAELEL